MPPRPAKRRNPDPRRRAPRPDYHLRIARQILEEFRADHPEWRRGMEWDPRRGRYVWPREQTWHPA